MTIVSGGGTWSSTKPLATGMPAACVIAAAISMLMNVAAVALHYEKRTHAPELIRTAAAAISPGVVEGPTSPGRAASGACALLQAKLAMHDN